MIRIQNRLKSSFMNIIQTPLRKWLLGLCASTLLVTMVSGCGYQMGMPYRKDVRTVAVPVWTRGKDVYRRDVEKRLTEALIKRIQLQTPYAIAPVSQADSKLTGSIEVIAQQVLSKNTDTGEAREREVTFVVSFLWVDLRNGKELAVRKRFRASGKYISEDPFNEDFFEGSEDAINEIAQRIVEQMQETF